MKVCQECKKECSDEAIVCVGCGKLFPKNAEANSNQEIKQKKGFLWAVQNKASNRKKD